MSSSCLILVETFLYSSKSPRSSGSHWGKSWRKAWVSEVLEAHFSLRGPLPSGVVGREVSPGSRCCWALPVSPENQLDPSGLHPRTAGGPLLYDGISLTMSSRVLNGSQRVVMDGVISADECQELQRLTNVSGKRSLCFCQRDPSSVPLPKRPTDPPCSLIPPLFCEQ